MSCALPWRQILPLPLRPSDVCPNRLARKNWFACCQVAFPLAWVVVVGDGGVTGRKIFWRPAQLMHAATPWCHADRIDKEDIRGVAPGLTLMTQPSRGQFAVVWWEAE